MGIETILPKKRRWLLATATGCGVAALIVSILSGGAAWRAWLAIAWLASAAPTGAVCLLLIGVLVPGPWIGELSPALKALALAAPVSALLFLPVLLALPQIYPWVGEAQGTGFREAYFSAPAFVIRVLVWFVVLNASALLVIVGRPGPGLASAALIVLTLLSTISATDLLLSLDSHYASSGFGLYALSIEIVSAYALATIAASMAFGDSGASGVVGGVLLSLTLLWAYFAFMPFFIGWSENTLTSAAWYAARAGFWTWAIVATGAVRMACAFLLLFRSMRNNPGRLSILAALTLVATLPEAAWLTLPAANGQPGPAFGSGVVLALGSGALASLAGALLLRERRP